MWGRGLSSSPETGKTDCFLLDFSGNIIRFAADYSEIFFDGLDALDAGEKLDKAIRRDDEEKPEGKACPACGFKPFARRCINCGHEHQAQSLVEHLPGEMQEIRIGKTKYADDARHLYEQACTYARAHSAPEKQAGRAYWIFKKISGVEPSLAWRFEDTPNVPITRAVMNKIRADNIAFSKRPLACALPPSPPPADCFRPRSCQMVGYAAARPRAIRAERRAPTCSQPGGGGCRTGPPTPSRKSGRTDQAGRSTRASSGKDRKSTRLNSSH